ncbi:MAG TPA: serine hydrolase domain-containing protein, partial [Gemmatimonadales bacterium]|nr:serine hydrolase domain-containing protein [Gemmatimonadales bacterium]
VDSLFAAYAAPGAPGAAVLVVHDTTVRIRTYGLADVATGAPVTPTTDFRLASLTKQFTATAILLLVNDGKLSLNDRLVDRVPGLPAYAHAIRLWDLLHHTSGIWDYEDFVPDSAPPVHDADVPALVSRADSLYFPPTSKYAYSNSGYALLALTVERAGGMPFATFLHDRIFAPLGMTRSVAHVEGVDTVPERAYGHGERDGKWVVTDQSNTSAVLGDGGVYTNVTDLAKWVRALWTAPLPGAALQATAWTPAALSDGTTGPYGMGWFVDTDRGLRRLSHHGETRGFTNGYVMYPDQRVAVIVLTDRSGGAPWDLAQQVADHELGLTGAPHKFDF